MKKSLKHLEGTYLVLSALAYACAAIYLAGFIGRGATVPDRMSGSITSNLPPQVFPALTGMAALACLLALGMAWLQFRGRRIGRVAFWLLAVGNLVGFAVVRGGMASLEGKYAGKSAYVAAVDTVAVPLLVITLMVVLAVMVRPSPAEQPPVARPAE